DILARSPMVRYRPRYSSRESRRPMNPPIRRQGTVWFPFIFIRKSKPGAFSRDGSERVDFLRRCACQLTEQERDSALPCKPAGLHRNCAGQRVHSVRGKKQLLGTNRNESYLLQIEKKRMDLPRRSKGN